jgi:homoserine acetyltransferase
MGGMQAYHWAACYPDMVERAAIVCGSARCSPYNHVFLEGVKAALTADPMFRDGRFIDKPSAGLRAMGRVYAGWAMSHAFYRDEAWREAGFSSLEDYLARAWDDAFSKRDANNLLAQIGIWQRGDISQCPEFGGDIGRALAAIRARVLLIRGRRTVISICATTRRRSADSSTQSGPSSIRSLRSMGTVPVIPSTIPQTAPSSMPRYRCCCSVEMLKSSGEAIAT